MEVSSTLLELLRAESRESRAEILGAVQAEENGAVQIITLFLETFDYIKGLNDELTHTRTAAIKFRDMIFGSSSEQLEKILRKGLGADKLKEIAGDCGLFDLFAGQDKTVPGLDSSDKDEKSGEPSDNEEEQDQTNPPVPDSGDAGSSEKSKGKKGRKSGSRNILNFDDLENNSLIKKVDIADKEHPEDALCPVCGTPMKVLGEEVYSRELSIEVNVVLERHTRKVYACPNHENHKAETPEIVRPKAQHTKLLSHTACGNKLLATIIWLKCSASLPLYRQERIFYELMEAGLEAGEIKKSKDFRIPNKSMSSWIIEVDQIAFRYVVDRLLYHLKQQNAIHVDETPMLVLRNESLREDGTRKPSYLWAAASVKWAEHRIAFFAYYPGRAGTYADDLLDDYEGTIITDEYKVYNHFTHRMLCWIHLDRKFKTCMKTERGAYTGKEPELLAHVIILIAKVFSIEKECKNMTAEQRLKVRQEKSKPLVEELFAYFRKLADEKLILPKSDFMAAVNYALKFEDNFKVFLNDGYCDISNNTVESNIRLIAIGRKNWMFAGAPSGAAPSGAVALADGYSLVETAVQNGLNPVKYLQYVADNIQKVPGYRKHPERLDNVVLPWCPGVVRACKTETPMPESDHTEENCVAAGAGCHESPETPPEASAGRKIINAVVNGVRNTAAWLLGRQDPTT
jgi:transposase